MYTLYGRPGSGSDAPQVLLEELGLPHRIVEVGRDAQQQQEYLRLNPTGKVPALVLPDGRSVFESAAICIHLTDAHPDAGLAPRPGTPEHASYLQWMVFLSANLYETFLRFYYSHRYSSGGEVDAPKVKQQAAADLERHFTLLETALQPFLLGDQPSAADYYLYMLATWHPSPAELYAKLPKLGALAEAVSVRPAIAKVMRENP